MSPWQRVAPYAIVVGAAAAILGAFLPWVEVTVPILGSISRSGVQGSGDGLFCVVAGAAAALVGVRLAMSRGRSFHAISTRIAAALVAVVGLAGTAFAVVAANRLDNRISDVVASLPRVARRLVSPHVGIGIYVVGLGGAVIAAAALLLLIASWREPRGSGSRAPSTGF